jgi:hypothetical protein
MVGRAEIGLRTTVDPNWREIHSKLSWEERTILIDLKERNTEQVAFPMRADMIMKGVIQPMGPRMVLTPTGRQIAIECEKIRTEFERHGITVNANSVSAYELGRKTME